MAGKARLSTHHVMSLRKFGSELCKHDKDQSLFTCCATACCSPPLESECSLVPSYRSAAEQPGITKLQGLSSMTPWKVLKMPFEVETETTYSRDARLSRETCFLFQCNCKLSSLLAGLVVGRGRSCWLASQGLGFQQSSAMFKVDPLACVVWSC